MQPFATLSHTGQIPRLRRLAAAALAQYGLEGAALHLLTHRGNTLFRVTVASASAVTPGPGSYILRVYGPRAPSPALIGSELAWLTALHAETDLRLPEPLPARDGAFVIAAEAPGVPAPRSCVLFRAVPGRFLDAGLTPAHLARVGAFMARLHDHAAGFQPPAGFLRPRWNWRGFFGPSSVFAPGRGAGLLTPADREVFAATAARVETEMAAADSGPASYGLIHNDLQHTNYLFHQGVAGAIDFEDCCWGYFLFDMTITLFEVAGRPAGAALQAAFLEGYTRVRPLPPDHAAGIRRFTAIRLAKRINYLAQAPDPALQAQAAGWVAYAVPRLRAFLAE